MASGVLSNILNFEVYRSLATATSYANRCWSRSSRCRRAACTAVYATSGYPNSAQRFTQTSTFGDNVFGDNTSAQIAAMTPALTGSPTAGYTGSVTVGLAL